MLPALIAITLCAAIAASIIYHTIRTGISPMPSSGKATRAILTASESIPDGRIVDGGSGWGTLALALAKKYPQRQVIGYELSLIPFLFSRILKLLFKRQNLSFERRDFLKADYSNTTVFICYLYPGGMEKVEMNIVNSGNPPSYIISNTFALPSIAATKTLPLNDLYNSKLLIYDLESRRLPGTEHSNHPDSLSPPSDLF